MTHRVRWRIVTIAVLLVSSAGAVWVGVAVHRSLRTVKDAYAQWHVGEMYVTYMIKHQGDPPRSWSDLEPLFADIHGSWYKWGELVDRITIDFSIDPRSDPRILDSDRDDVPRIVSLKKGPGMVYEGGDPNKIIADYVRQRRRAE